MSDTSSNIPLTTTTRAIVVTVHFLTFVVSGWTVWAILRKQSILEKRIWSPFLLLSGAIFLQLAAAFEIANHYYEGNFALDNMKTDFINGIFYFFNIAAIYLNALGLRNKTVPFFRCPSFVGNIGGGLLNLLVMVFDLFLVVGIFITLPIYFTSGRAGADPILTAFGAIAGVGILFRLWRNLGPSRGTLLGGVFFFFFAIMGVIMSQVYLATGIEWLHALISGSDVMSMVPFTCAILCVIELDPKLTEGDGEAGENGADGGVELTSIPL